MSFLLLCSLLGIHISLSNAVALPSYALYNLRNANVTIPPPTSFSGEEHSWQRNVYILQVTRIALLIFLAISMHIIYARWQLSKHHRDTGSENPHMAMGTRMDVSLGAMSFAVGVVGDNEPGISAQTIQTDMAAEPAPAISVQHGNLRAPSRAHERLSSSERASAHAEAPIALHGSNRATETTAPHN